MITQLFHADGHLIDSGILSQVLNLIIEDGAEYEIISFTMGKSNLEPSHLELKLIAKTSEQCNALAKKLIRFGLYEKKPVEAILKKAEKDKCAPLDFYSSTNHRTEVFHENKWHEVQNQRMDAVIVKSSSFLCKKLRDIVKGDLVLCNSESVRVFPPFRDRVSDDFSFMSNDVSSERSVELAVKKISEELIQLKQNGKKVVVVAGPVVVHTDSAKALGKIIKKGYIQGLLSGNALAVHDLENQFFGSSLGINMKTGKPMYEGHQNHMKAINKIYTYGSIKNAIDSGELKSGLMFDIITSNLDYCLAGSIRDDGPLPETETDMIKAQEKYAAITKNASLVLMLGSMLHSIGTGNMLPSWTKTVCIDINPAVVTKLSDRGSSQTIGIVCDVGLFLNLLAHKLD